MAHTKIIENFIRIGVLRAGIALGGVASVSPNGVFESKIIDLRDQLPKHEYLVYKERTLPPNTLIWHHTATKGSTIRSMADYHVQQRGWPEIAYHYAIGYDGRIYYLVRDDKVSYHASGNNSRAIGVALIGNYHERALTEEMKISIRFMYHMLRNKYPSINVQKLHRETKATICPGQYASEYIKIERDEDIWNK